MHSSTPSSSNRQRSTPVATSEKREKFVPVPSYVAPRGKGCPGQILIVPAPYPGGVRAKSPGRDSWVRLPSVWVDAAGKRDDTWRSTMSDHDGFEQHDHPALAHSHVHYHVTHNYNDASGGFVHLSSRHEHEHDHAALTHAHFPHENFEQEHEGEAHIHDHEQAVRPTTARKAAKAPAKSPAKASASDNGEGKTVRATRAKKVG